MKVYGISYIIDGHNTRKTIRRHKGGGSMKQYISLREAAEKCVSAGLLVLTAKSLMRLLPPLTITDEELDRGLSILEKVLTDCGGKEE